MKTNATTVKNVEYSVSSVFISVVHNRNASGNICNTSLSNCATSKPRSRLVLNTTTNKKVLFDMIYSFASLEMSLSLRSLGSPSIPAAN